MELLKISVYLSLLIQIFTGLFDYYVIQLNIPNKIIILKKLLIMELIVQIVEGIFYIWLAINISSVANITPHRYYDWYLTTPTMLVTLCVYLIYLRNEEENKETEHSLVKIVYDNLNTLIPIIFLNFVMLTAGFLTEIKKLSRTPGVLFGFIPFLIYFYLIYENYAKFSQYGSQIFFYFFIIWFAYGIAALMNYKTKNIMYNILDLFAKNFFGLYLGFVVLIAMNK
jgi:bacteriorhodopsin